MSPFQSAPGRSANPGATPDCSAPSWVPSERLPGPCLKNAPVGVVDSNLRNTRRRNDVSCREQRPTHEAEQVSQSVEGTDEPIFRRIGDLVLFNQYGIKLDFRNETSDEEYYSWLDNMIRRIGTLMPGAKIVEKAGDRQDPRRNTGVYYDTAGYRLLHEHMVLRTTSNPRTHAFCAFKYGADENDVRRDHRYVFDGDEKRTIQLGPTSEAAVSIVRRLLRREDIDHPGTFLKEATGITADDLTPAVLLAQYRRTFYVWLDGEDALRCSLDRADVSDLRANDEAVAPVHFSEVELPIYPRISPTLMRDPRVTELIQILARSLVETFGVEAVQDAKYRRAAHCLGLLP